MRQEEAEAEAKRTQLEAEKEVVERLPSFSLSRYYLIYSLLSYHIASGPERCRFTLHDVSPIHIPSSMVSLINNIQRERLEMEVEEVRTQKAEQEKVILCRYISYWHRPL